MKKLFILFSLIVFAVSCKKENDPDNYKQLIIGTWNCIAIGYEGDEITISDLGWTLRFTFKSDNTWTGTSRGFGVDFGSGTYNISGNDLTIVELGTKYYLKIGSLSENRFVLNWPELEFDFILEK